MNKVIRTLAAPDAMAEFPYRGRDLFSSLIFCAIGVFMTFGVGMFVVIFAEGAINFFNPEWTQIFGSNQNTRWATEQLIAHTLDLAAALLIFATATEIKPSALCWYKPGKRFGLGLVKLLAGVAIGYAMYYGLVYLANAWIQPPAVSGPQMTRTLTLTGWQILPMMISTLVVSPVMEELVFRGYVYNVMRTSFRTAMSRYTFAAELIAMLLSAALFTIVHAFGASPFGLLTIFIGSLIMTELYRRTGSLAAPVLMHFVLNAAIWYRILA